MRDFQAPGRSTVHALNGMAATSHPLATLAAVDMLRAGGTAADAAVTAAALLGVVEPHATGIGGDAFALYSPGGGDNVIAYNGSGAAPLQASADWYLQRGIKAIPLTGAHSVTVPGAVDLWATLLERHGCKGIDAALQPAIRAAEDGFVVSPRTAWDWARNREKLRNGINVARYFLFDGEAPAVGTVIRQPALASTLLTIAAKGRDGFYLGEIAEDIVTTLHDAGGLHTAEDLQRHRTDIAAAISTHYRYHQVWQCPPNSPGVTMLIMLNVLSGFDLPRYAPLSVERLHLQAEAARHAYLAVYAICFGNSRPDPARPRQRAAAGGRADASVHRLPLRGRPRPQCMLVRQFARACVWIRRGCRQVRRPAAEQRCRVPHRAGSSKLHRRGQAPVAHAYCRARQQRRPRRHAVRRDGRSVPAHRPGAPAEQYA
jgi:gamma-glutamyltranspeptidase